MNEMASSPRRFPSTPQRFRRGASASRLACLIVAVAAVAAVAAPAPASADSRQYAVATDGWLTWGGTAPIEDPRGGTFKFKAVVMAPQGAIEGNGPQLPGGPDARAPWVSLTESHKAPSGWQSTVCSVLRNVSPELSASVRVGQVPDFHVDVDCADGRGYDFYRLHWKGTEPVDWGTAHPATIFYRQAWWGPDHPFDQPHYTGTAEWATSRSDSKSRALFRICGYRDAEADCFAPEGRADPWQHVLIEGGWTSIAVRFGWTDRGATCC